MGKFRRMNKWLARRSYMCDKEVSKAVFAFLVVAL
jgi:hypothetical protein